MSINPQIQKAEGGIMSLSLAWQHNKILTQKPVEQQTNIWNKTATRLQLSIANSCSVKDGGV